MLKKNPVQHYIPWRPVWNENSLTTPFRIVFNASNISECGYSLNNIPVKGCNNMNKLVEIFVR